MFLNVSNHPSENWSVEQREAALRLVAENGGIERIEDYPFPQVKASMTEAQIEVLSEQIVGDIISRKPTVVMCQGEYTLTYQLVKWLQKKGIKVVAACSERQTVETILEDGSTKREAVFTFVQFREYR